MIAQRHKVYPEQERYSIDPEKMHLANQHHGTAQRLTAVAVVGLLLAVAGYCWLALTRLPPRVSVGGVAVGLLTSAEALERFRAQAPPLPVTLSLIPDSAAATISATVSAAQLGLHREPEQALATVFNDSTPPLQRLTNFTRGCLKSTSIPVPVLFDESALLSTIEDLAVENYRAGREPSITLGSSGVAASLSVDRGELGIEIDATTSAQQVGKLLQEQRDTYSLPVRATGRRLSETEAQQSLDVAAKFVGKSLDIVAERLQLNVHDKEIIALINPPNQWNYSKIDELVADWQKQTGTQPQNPELTYDPATLKVTTFSPPRNGRTIQAEPTKAVLLSSFEELASSTETKHLTKQLVLAETPPTTSLASLNSLGINERIGFGESYYAHSIPNRIHNVAITAQRIDDTIIPPGAEFSFNKTLGEVSAATGYKAAYVIKNGKTELGDGGGVCQVSTTVFRAVLNAGLEITKRIAHSYRVSYYELDRKPGMDATVYAGDVDFRFKNDTASHILLHTVTDDKNTYMYVELYGTSDGRRTEIVEHKTWDARPALAPQYFPDPSLPPGKLVQIDWAAPGIRASVTNVIYNSDGSEKRRDTFTSNYKPWAAKYLQGIAPQ